MTLALRYAVLASIPLLVGCSNPRRPAQRPARPAAPVAAPDVVAPRADASAVVAAPTADPTTDADAGTATAGSPTTATPAAATDAGGGVRVFRVGEPACVRDPERDRLGASVAGFFTTDRLELEVRNVRHGCAPGPRFAARLDGTTVRLTYDAPTPAALARCACRHDFFLHIVGIPAGEYAVEVQPTGRGDAGPPIAQGRIAARRP